MPAPAKATPFAGGYHLRTPSAAVDGTQDVLGAAKAVQPKVVAWRRDIHEHPELGNSEVRTAKLVADHLRTAGFEVTSGPSVGCSYGWKKPPSRR